MQTHPAFILTPIAQFFPLFLKALTLFQIGFDESWEFFLNSSTAPAFCFSLTGRGTFNFPLRRYASPLMYCPICHRNFAAGCQPLMYFFVTTESFGVEQFF
jgi:hypothetical protein